MSTAPSLPDHAPAGPLALDFPDAPTAPFGVIALPRPDVPVTEWGLKLAYAALLAHYRVPATPAERGSETRAIGAQLDKALALTLDRSRWTIHPDHVAIIGSQGDRYRTTPAGCEGPRWVSRGRSTTVCKGATRAAVGMCVHQLAVEYLRLAQELDPSAQDRTADAPAMAEIARAEVPGCELFAMLGRIRVKQRRIAAEEVAILLSGDDQLISLSSGGLYGATGPATVTGGAYGTLTPDEFAELWSAAGDAAREIPVLTLAILADAQAEGILTVRGGALDLAVAIRAMAC